MAKRSTAPAGAAPAGAPAGAAPATKTTALDLDARREAFLEGFAWPAETPDAAKALAVEAVTAFAVQLADLVRPVAPEPPDAGGMITVVVTGPREGRYRCGRHFTEVTTAPFAVTPADFERLKADPKLMVMPAAAG